MTQARITLRADAAPLNSAIGSLLAEFSKRALQPGLIGARASEALAQPARIEQRDFSAPGASEVGLILHPSDALLGLLAAVRAGDFDV
jgi:hypothetical protein